MFDKRFPYTDFNKINLDWIMRQLKQRVDSVIPAIIPLYRGGTGADNAEDARTNLGLGNLAIENSPLSVSKGGTGATAAAAARTNLGLGNLAVENSPLPISKGGTGATAAAAARTNLGLGNLAAENSPLPVNKGGTGATAAADARTNLGLGNLAIENSPLSVSKGGTGATAAAAARTNLGLGNLAVENSPLPISKGGTGATAAAAARGNLNVPRYVFLSWGTALTFTMGVGTQALVLMSGAKLYMIWRTGSSFVVNSVFGAGDATMTTDTSTGEVVIRYNQSAANFAGLAILLN